MERVYSDNSIILLMNIEIINSLTNIFCLVILNRMMIERNHSFALRLRNSYCFDNDDEKQLYIFLKLLRL